MYKKTLFVLLVLLAHALFAQQTPQNSSVPQKYALVIGNGAYTGLSRLANPTNDADDVAAALEELGFTVDKLLNGSLEQMENAVMRLKNRLSVSADAYGMFFYAGHGVQSNGENYLVPADANIPGENALRNRAVSVQWVLDELNDASNSLNVVVLDACRDNPFGWARSGTRGLSIVGRQPADSIIVYATSAGQTASDGTGRNGLFTGELLKNLKQPGLEVKEVFNRTGADVAQASGRRQIPAVYNQFFGTAYLGERPVVRPPTVFEAGAAIAATGALEILTVTAGTVEITGTDINQMVELPDWGSLPIAKINAGNYRVVMRYEDGKTEEKTVEVGRSQEIKLEFSYRPTPLPVKPAPAPRPKPAPKPPKEPRPPKVISPEADKAARLNTLGVSVGTAFADPLVIATVRGTYAPGRNWFLEAGFDLGLVSMYKDVKTYYSVYPFAHAGLFAPFRGKGGWYFGAGGGYMAGGYTFTYSESKIPIGVFAADLVTGFNIGNFFDISYTLRTNFGSLSNKVSAGYIKRF